MEYDNQIDNEIEEFSQKSFREMDIDEERSNKIVINNMGMSIDLEFPQNLSKSKIIKCWLLSLGTVRHSTILRVPEIGCLPDWLPPSRPENAKIIA